MFLENDNHLLFQTVRERVIFRKFKGGEIIALFPNDIANSNGDCNSYMHLGQHSPADYNAVIKATKPATQEEYADLYNELKSLGYEYLNVRKRR